MEAEMVCCWRASLMYNNENNKLVLSRQYRTMPSLKRHQGKKASRQQVKTFTYPAPASPVASLACCLVASKYPPLRLAFNRKDGDPNKKVSKNLYGSS